MKHTVITNPMQLRRDVAPIVACMGYFDGLHLGHQHLFKETIRIAKEKGIESAIITFDPDPWTIIHKNNSVKHLTPIKEKLLTASKLGIDHMITIHFDSAVSKLSPAAYIEYYLIPLKVDTLVVGADFKFGYKGAGNVHYLQHDAAVHFKTVVVDIDRSNNTKIGTTAITQALLKGDIEVANAMLGRDYVVSGFVVDGQKQGRKIGFPTANMLIVDEYVIPGEGVYAGKVVVRDKTYNALISIGHNPTFNQTQQLSIETHILDFSEDIYGEHIKQYFSLKLRDQVKFDSIALLVEQMHRDEAKARAYFNDHQ